MRKTALRAIAAALCTFAALSHTAAAAVPDPVPAPVPRYLIGLWALGHKCNAPSKQLRITAHTMQFGTEPPVRFEYYPPEGPLDSAGLNPEGNGPVWEYFRPDDVIFDYGVSRTEDDIYYRCPVGRTGRK